MSLKLLRRHLKIYKFKDLFQLELRVLAQFGKNSMMSLNIEDTVFLQKKVIYVIIYFYI